MLNCPCRSPRNTSSRLLGNCLRSSRLVAASRISSRFQPCRSNPVNARTRSPRAKAAVCRFRYDRITPDHWLRDEIRQAYFHRSEAAETAAHAPAVRRLLSPRSTKPALALPRPSPIYRPASVKRDWRSLCGTALPEISFATRSPHYRAGRRTFQTAPRRHKPAAGRVGVSPPHDISHFRGTRPGRAAVA